MTAIVWLIQWGFIMTSSVVLGSYGSINATSLSSAAIRFLVAVVGAGSTLLVAAAIRRRNLTPAARLVICLCLAAPLAAALAAFNESLWLLSGFYKTRMGIGWGDVVSSNCLGTATACRKVLGEAVMTFGLYIWVFISWSALYVGIAVASDLRDHERRLADAESAAHQAQLSALRFQLNPHFLFNTLNTLSGLVALERKRLAEDMILNLSSFMRYSLEGGSVQLVPLSKELEAQRLYLDIERVRFSDRLVVEYHVAEEAKAALVPSFVLQPLIENSIKYAVAPSETAITLLISACVRGEELVVTVENSPTARGGRPPSGLGIGLDNVRKRLEAIYAGHASLEVGERSGGGWFNIIHLPWMESHGSTPSSSDCR